MQAMNASRPGGATPGLRRTGTTARSALFGVLCIALSSPSFAAVDSNPGEILAYLAAHQQAFDALEAPDPEQARAFAERIERAAAVARSLGRRASESEALIVLGTHYADRDEPAQAEAAFGRARLSAQQSGDAARELRALDGVLNLLLDKRSGGESKSPAERDRFHAALVAFVDVAVTHERIVEAVAWLDEAGYEGARPVSRRAKELRGVLVEELDAVARARVTGETKSIPASIGRLWVEGLALLAGSVAEEFEQPGGLEIALETHQARGDGAAEARVSRILLRLLPAGEERDALRRRAYAAALSAGEFAAAAEWAPDDGVADSLRELAGPPLTEQERAIADFPLWRQEGRRPNERDVFVDKIAEHADPDYFLTKTTPGTLTSGNGDVIEMAHADGSRAFVPIFFDVLERGGNAPEHLLAAARALGELAGLEDVEALVAALDHEDWEVRRLMAMTLVRMAPHDERVGAGLERRLAAEEVLAVAAALRWGLIEAGHIEPHRAELEELMKGSDERAAATAGVALFDYGFGTAATLLESNARVKRARDADADIVELLAFSTRPDAVGLLDRFVDRNAYTVPAARALTRFDTPRARDIRKRERGEAHTGVAPLWFGLRDARRGRMTPETKNWWVERSQDLPLKGHVFTSEMLEWSVDESEGEVDLPWKVRDEEIVASQEIWSNDTRRALKALKGRKRYPRAPQSNDPEAGWSVHLLYRTRMRSGSVNYSVRPRATLVDPTYLSVALNASERHSGIDKDILGALWVEFELELEAEDAHKQTRLEGVPGLTGPLVADSADVPTFDIPEGVTAASLRQGELVLDFKFFDEEKTLRIPLAGILIESDAIAPDLIVEGISIEPAAPRPGQAAYVSFDVVNAGHAVSAKTTVVVQVHNALRPESPQRLRSVGVPALKQGERVTTTVGVTVSAENYLSGYRPGWTPDDQDTAIEVVVDPEGKVDESEEGNNRSLRPVALILNEEERGARNQEQLLVSLNTLADRVEELGPGAPPDVLRDALREVLEGLDAVRPRTPALDKARQLIRMLGAQAEARGRIKNATDRMRDFNRVPGSDEEARDALRDLVRAQADLIRSGVPVSAEQVAAINENVVRFHETFGASEALLDKAQSDVLETAAEQGRIRAGTREIFGEMARSPESGFEELLGPPLNAENRGSAEAFLDRNIEWSRDGIALADQMFDAAISNPDGGFAPGALDVVAAGNEAWSLPPSETVEQVDSLGQGEAPSPAAPAARKTARSLLKNLGF